MSTASSWRVWRCTSCKLRIKVEVEEPVCPRCGYNLHQLMGPICLECGTPLLNDEIGAIAQSARIQSALPASDQRQQRAGYRHACWKPRHYRERASPYL